jgi:hypothetical protein
MSFNMSIHLKKLLVCFYVKKKKKSRGTMLEPRTTAINKKQKILRNLTLL